MAKIKDILSNISNVKVGTWVRGILLIISLVNMALSAAGKAPIPADYNEIYTIVDEVQVGNSKWGLLKSYKNSRNGWINVTEGRYVTKVKVK